MLPPSVLTKVINIIDCNVTPSVQTKVIDITYPAEEGPDGLLPALLKVSEEAAKACQQNHQLLVLSDRATGPKRIPIPSLLALGRIHHYLIKEKLRLKAGLIVETGEAR